MPQTPESILKHWLPELEKIAREAGAAIMEVYQRCGDIQVQTKTDDSPLTLADHAAHHVIVAGLQALTPELPVLSEESELPDYNTRKAWGRYWLVDPLDGTKEFINRNGEFTVNIALIDQHRALLGLVYLPVQQVLYVGEQGVGAWRVDANGRHSIRCQPLRRDARLKVVASRRHGAEALAPLLERAETLFAGVDHVSFGSSLKICLLAEGKADWYPRLAPTCEWDTAAAQAVLEAAGGQVLDADLQPLRYNRGESVLNPHFHAVADPAFPWRQLISAE